MALAKTEAEILLIFFGPFFSGTEEDVNPVALIFELQDKIEDAGDAGLQEHFDALLESEGDQEDAVDLFQYIFESLPEVLTLAE